MIKVYIGISGSGKTTKCLEDLSKDPKGVRVNRDDMRYAIYGLTDETYGDYFKREDWYQCEQVITDLENRLIKRAITRGNNVYADNTHLKQKYIKKYYNYGVPVELVFLNRDVEYCISNDNGRVRRVGEEIIRKQFDSFNILLNNWEIPDKKKNTVIHNIYSNIHCVVFDIDGTLAEMKGRSPYEYDKVETDRLRDSVYEAYRAHEEYGHKIIICTGRDGVCEIETRKWLIDHRIECEKFYIRPQGDNRPDWQVKEEMWKDICKDYYITAMYDDRNQVVEHGRSLGFNVFQVAEGDF